MNHSSLLAVDTRIIRQQYQTICEGLMAIYLQMTQMAALIFDSHNPLGPIDADDLIAHRDMMKLLHHQLLPEQLHHQEINIYIQQLQGKKTCDAQLSLLSYILLLAAIDTTKII